MHVIKSFSKEEKVDAINILLLAFSSDPFQRYMMPDPSIYFRNSTIWFNNAIKQSILVKGVWGTENYSGVAVWFPPRHKIEFEVIQKTFKDFPSVIEKDIYQYFKEFGKNKPVNISPGPFGLFYLRQDWFLWGLECPVISGLVPVGFLNGTRAITRVRGSHHNPLFKIGDD